MKSKSVYFPFLLALLIVFVIAGCSSGGAGPTVPTKPQDSNVANVAVGTELGEGSPHYPLGFFACTADPVAGTLEIEPIRLGEQHINAVFFLQGGPEQLLTIESPPKFSEGGKRLDVDIGIKHPMDDPIFTGFDVRAILMSKGSIIGWADSSIKVAGQNETRLINPDGYTRWWNPMEFTQGGIYGYLPGYLGQEISPGDAAIINGFKYFADGLGPNDDFASLNASLRGMFSTGNKLVRHFAISLKGGNIFNYAVDASWSFPNAVPPTPPDDFPLKANELEPYRIAVDEWVNTLWYDGTEHGGNIFLRITAYDWQGVSTIGGGFLEIPNLGIEKALNDILEVGDNYITWEYRIYNPKIKKAGPADILVTVYSPEGDYQPKQTGVYKFFRAYTLVTTNVRSEKIEPVPPVAFATAQTTTVIAKHETVTFYGGDSYDPDGIDLTYEWDFNGDGVYGDPFESGTPENPTAVFDAGGIFGVNLKVTDVDGLSDITDLTIVVMVSNQAPTACAEMSGHEPYYGDAIYTFDGSCSTDPDGEVSTYSWDFDYDGVTFAPDDYGKIVKHSFPVGTSSIMLCVADDDGSMDYLDEPITREFVYKDNVPPVIDSVEFSRTTVLKNSDVERVLLTVHYTDPDVIDEHTVDWFAAGGEFEKVDETSAYWKAIDEVGHFNITVRVTDLFGTYDEDDSMMIRVTKYPTGQNPWGFKYSVPAPPWSMVTIPDQLPMDSGPYIPGKVNFMLFLRYC